MKRTFLILIIASLGWNLSAQDTLSWKQTLQRHDIQIGIGDPLLPVLATGHYLGIQKDYYYERNATDWFGPDIYKCVYWTPTISVGYKYRLTKWFWLGATISYTGLYDVYHDRVTNEKVSTQSDHIITIMPSVRFSWLNKKYVTLYSGLSLGYALDIYNEYNSNYPNQRYTGCGHGALFQLTAVGVHVGRKWYGFAEIGFGIQGIFQAGFGYNFNSKKK